MIRWSVKDQQLFADLMLNPLPLSRALKRAKKAQARGRRRIVKGNRLIYKSFDPDSVPASASREGRVGCKSVRFSPCLSWHGELPDLLEAERWAIGFGTAAATSA